MTQKSHKYAKIARYSIFAFIALLGGAFMAVQRHDSSLTKSVILDLETGTASADTPDSGSGSADSGSGSSDSGSGSGDCGSGDCGG